MRIPYPERISYTGATVFAALLLIVQLFEHTETTFALCCFAYVMVATTAFNLAGGLYRPAGAFIFFNAVLTLLVGLVAKAIFMEPADSNLLSPTRTIEVYLLGMVAMLVAAYVETRFRPRRALIAKWLPLYSLRGAYYGAAIIGLGFNLFWLSAPRVAAGTILSALRYANEMLPFAVILGVLHTVRSTNGKRSMTLLLFVILVLTTFEGLIDSSKQGVLVPGFCWLLGAGIARYKLKPINFFAIGLAVFLLVYVGVPVVQVGKNIQKRRDYALNIAITMNLLQNFQATKAEYKQGISEDYGTANYYNNSEGFLDRLQMISMDDLLVDETDRDGFFGYEPFKEAWGNLVPHILWKDKPNPYFGNTYAHQLGILSDDDPMTGVSFSPSADAYKQGGFTGVLLMETFSLIVIFLSFSIVLGDLRDHPTVILMVLIVAHIAPEGLIPGAIQLIFYIFLVVGFAIFCRYIAPVVASATLPPAVPRLGDLAPAID